MTRPPMPDASLCEAGEIRERIQTIQRQRYTLAEKGPRRTRSGATRPDWQDAHVAALKRFDARADALSLKLRNIGA